MTERCVVGDQCSTPYALSIATKRQVVDRVNHVRTRGAGTAIAGTQPECWDHFRARIVSEHHPRQSNPAAGPGRGCDCAVCQPDAHPGVDMLGQPVS